MLGFGPNLAKLARRIGMPAEALELDKPLPMDKLIPEAEFKGSIGFRRSILNLATKDGLTVRELSLRYGGGHQEVVGTPEQVADIMQDWMEAGAADGFTLMVDMLPSGLEQIVELLVPELQRRGMFHRDYEHATLAANLDLVPRGTPFEAVAE